MPSGSRRLKIKQASDRQPAGRRMGTGGWGREAGYGATCLSTNFTRENFGLVARGAAAELRRLIGDFFREDLSTFFHVVLQLSLR